MNDKPSQPLASTSSTGLSNPVARFGLSCLVVWLFLMADLLVVPGMCIWDQEDWGAVFVYVLLGIIVAQFAVLPAWLAWGQPAFWLRLLIVGGLGVVFVGAWFLGFGIGSWIDGRALTIREQEQDELIAAALLLPPIILALELPLHTVRALFGWRLGFIGEGANVSRPLAIGDLLVAMALVAVALTCARLANEVVGRTSESEFWLALGIGTACGATASVLLILPLAWFSFRLASLPLVLAAVGLFCILATGALWGTISLVFRGPRMNLWEMIGLGITGSVGMYTVAAIILVARAAGYRLAAGRSQVA